MSFNTEGTIKIDLAEFWRWVRDDYSPFYGETEIQFGVPRIDRDNQTLDIDFAASSECNPTKWVVKPKAVTQWTDS